MQINDSQLWNTTTPEQRQNCGMKNLLDVVFRQEHNKWDSVQQPKLLLFIADLIASLKTIWFKQEENRYAFIWGFEEKWNKDALKKNGTMWSMKLFRCVIACRNYLNILINPHTQNWSNWKNNANTTIYLNTVKALFFFSFFLKIIHLIHQLHFRGEKKAKQVVTSEVENPMLLPKLNIFAGFCSVCQAWLIPCWE